MAVVPSKASNGHNSAIHTSSVYVCTCEQQIPLTSNTNECTKFISSTRYDQLHCLNFTQYEQWRNNGAKNVAFNKNVTLVTFITSKKSSTPMRWKGYWNNVCKVFFFCLEAFKQRLGKPCARLVLATMTLSHRFSHTSPSTDNSDCVMKYFFLSHSCNCNLRQCTAFW